MTTDLKLQDILSSPETLHWAHGLYMPRDSEWDLETPCLVWDVDDCEADSDEPKEAVDRGFKYVLGIQAVQGIVQNARTQLPRASSTDLLNAFIYYFEHDAFIDFSVG